MSRPPVPSARPVLRLLLVVMAAAGLGRVLVGSGEPGLAGTVVVVLAMIGLVVAVLSRDSGALASRWLPPSLFLMFVVAAIGAFAL